MGENKWEMGTTMMLKKRGEYFNEYQNYRPREGKSIDKKRKET